MKTPQKAAFTLMEILVCLAIISSLAAIGMLNYQNFSRSSANAKLDNDVRVLNTAIRIYKTNGGQFTASNVEEALRQIRRKADPTRKNAGLQGSMVDERLTTRYQTAQEASGDEKRVYFDATKQAFYVANRGTEPGVKEFYLGSAPPPLPTYVDESGKTVDPNLDDRQTYGKFANADRWVWDYHDASTVNHGSPIDTGNNVGTPNVAPPISDSPLIKLPPPLFSTPGGGFDLSWYPQAISLSPDPDVPPNVSEIHYLSSGQWVRYNGPLTISEPGQVITAKLVSTSLDDYSDSDEATSAYNAGPFLLDVGTTLRASYSYTDLGGPLLTGSTAPALAPVPRISLANAAGLPDQFENDGVFQMNWTWNGADPLTTTPLAGNGSFTNGYPGDNVPLSLATYGNGNFATLKVAAISKKTSLVQSSPVKTFSTGISVLTLPPPLVSRSTNATTLVQTVTLALDPSGNQTPANARIFYRTDDQDPGDNNGEPTAGATLYTGPITVHPAVASVTSIRARAYAPAAYKAWFSPSSGTYLEPLFNPYLLEADVNLPASYTYTDLGGPLATGSTAPARAPYPKLTLTNAADVPDALETAEFFQGNWTLNSTDPTDITPLLGNSTFTNGYPGDTIPINLSDFGSNTSLTVKAATVSKNDNVHRSSDVVAKTVAIHPLALRAPLVSRSTNASTLVQTVTLSLDITGNKTPANARIYYRTDGEDPGTTGGEPNAGATLYTGPITVSAANGSTTSIRARVYAPTAYKTWFTPSSDTYLEPLFEPYPLEPDFTLPATYNYAQLGGPLAPGSAASTPLAAPVLTLTNAADIPTALENAAFFQANWTLDGSNPLTATPLRGNSTFTGGYPGDPMSVSLSNFTNGVLTLKAAAIAKNPGVLTSDVVSKSATIQTLPLLAPLVTRTTTGAPTNTTDKPLGIAQDFSIFAYGNIEIVSGGGSTVGGVAAGGNLKYGYNGGFYMGGAAGRDALVVNGVLDTNGNGSLNNGNVTYGSTPNASLINSYNGTKRQATNVIDFAGIKTSHLALSAQWKALPNTGSGASITYGTPGGDGKVPITLNAANQTGTVVFNMDASKLVNVAYWNINNVNSAATILITIPGATPTLQNFYISNSGTANKTIFHFPDATTATFSSVGIPGTVFAPKALVSLGSNGSQIGGQIISDRMELRSFHNGGQYAFTGTISGGTTVQTVTMTLDLTGNQTPANARIYYRTDGTDPGNTNGEPNSGATLYTGPITVTDANLATTNIKARVYAPTAYKPWFTPSTATHLPPVSNLIQLASNVNLPATYSYTQLGGALAPGSGASSPVAAPVLTLTNAADISNSFETAAHFQGNWTFDGSDPLTKTPRLGNSTFTNGYPGDNVPISLASFGSNTSLTLKAALVSKNAGIQSSSVVTKTSSIAPLPLLPPVFDRTVTSTGTHTVVLSLDTTGNQTPANARIYYRTDGVDPGNSSGEPNTGASLYSGTITLPAASASTTTVLARVYPPTAYKNWFTSSNAATSAPPVKPKLKLQNLRNSYTYADVGGPFVTGLSLPPSPVAGPTVILDNNPTLPLNLQNSNTFQVRWTTNGSDPITSTTASVSGTFTNGFPGQQLSVAYSLWGTNTSLPLKVATKTLSAISLTNSDVLAPTVASSRTMLPKPIVGDTYTNTGRQIVISADVNSGLIPPGTRIYYTTSNTAPGVTRDSNGLDNASSGTLYTGPIDVPNGAFTVTARLYPPTDKPQWFSASDSRNIYIPVGFGTGHMDVDTSSALYDFRKGKTDGHVHEYDKKYDVSGINCLSFRDNKLKNLQEKVSANQKFKIIVANADLSPGARLVINNSYNSGMPTTWTLANVYDNTALASLPTYSLGGVAGTTRLTDLGVYFDPDSMGLHQTATGEVTKNVPGKYGEWRNGALTIQIVKVNDNGTPAFSTTTSYGGGGVHGVATSGLLWECTLFHHTDPYNK